MENSLFRKKSLERISSPEELHDYMRVTSPRLWMILGAIAVLLVGFIVYASTAKMENKMPITVQVDIAESGEERDVIVTSHLPLSYLGTVKTGMTVRIGAEEGTIDWIAANEKNSEIVFVVDMKNSDIPLKDGSYDAELVIETTTPISFLWN